MTQLLRILQSVLPDADVENCTTIIDDGLLDSFNMITLNAEISDQFDIQIPVEEVVPENYNSYAALCAMVKRLMDD